MNYIGLNKFDTANGKGIRVSLFVSGCTLHCKGCFNQESWDFNAGKRFTEDTLYEIFEALDNPYVDGLSILGGDPFEKQNVMEVLHIVSSVRWRFPKKRIWIWTGRKHEHLKEDENSANVLDFCDVLIDGPFIEKLKINEKGFFYGSSNQRVILLKPIEVR